MAIKLTTTIPTIATKICSASTFGKDYGVYFSILSAIAEGLTSQSEIDSVIQKNTGAYLQNLHRIFGVIEPIRPLYSKQESRNVR